MSISNSSHIEWLPASQLVAKVARERIMATTPPVMTRWELDHVTTARNEHVDFRLDGVGRVSAFYASYGPTPVRASIQWIDAQAGAADRVVGPAEHMAVANALFRADHGPLRGGGHLLIEVLGTSPTDEQKGRILDEIAGAIPEITESIRMHDAAWASGLGAAITAREVASSIGAGAPRTFAISGYDAVSVEMAKHLCAAGLTLVAVSDGEDATLSPEGLSPEDLDHHLRQGGRLSECPDGEPASRHDVIAARVDILAVCARGAVAAQDEMVAVRRGRGVRQSVAAQKAGVLLADDVGARVVVLLDPAAAYPGALYVLEDNGVLVIPSPVAVGLGAHVTELMLSGESPDRGRLEQRALGVYDQVRAHARDRSLPPWVAAYELAHSIRVRCEAGERTM